jgi:hypothetical protein
MKTLKILALSFILPCVYAHAQFPGSVSSPLVAADLGLKKSSFHRNSTSHGLVVTWKDADGQFFDYVILGDITLTALYGAPVWNRATFIFELYYDDSRIASYQFPEYPTKIEFIGSQALFKTAEKTVPVLDFKVTQELHETLISMYPDLPAAPLAAGQIYSKRYEKKK